MVENLKNQIKTKFGTLNNFAEKLGIDNSTLNRKLINPSNKFKLQLKEFGFFLEPNINEETMDATIQPAPGSWYKIVSRITTGGEMPYEQKDIIGEAFFNYPSKECFCVIVTGDAMAPKLLQGDILLIDPYEQTFSGDIVVAQMEAGRMIIKKLQITEDGTKSLHSINPAHPVIYLQENDRYKLYRAVQKQTIEQI